LGFEEELIREMLDELLTLPAGTAVAIDTETRDGLSVADDTAKVIGVSLAWPGCSCYIAVAHESGGNVSQETVDLLDRALRGKALVLVNAQFDLIGLYQFGIDLRDEEVYDLAVSVSVSRTRVPIGGSVRASVKLTNRGNTPVPTRAEPRLVFGGEINTPGRPNHRGRALYARVTSRSRGADCAHGLYGYGSKLQVFGCRVVRLAPGESETAILKVTKITAPIMLDTHAPGGDDRRGNDDFSPVVHVG